MEVSLFQSTESREMNKLKLLPPPSLPDSWKSSPLGRTKWNILGRLFDFQIWKKKKMEVVKLGGATTHDGGDGESDTTSIPFVPDRSSWSPDQEKRWPIQGW